LKQKQNERKIKNGKNEFTVCTKNLIRKPSHMKEVATFQIWKEKSLCPKKKFCNQNQYLKKIKILFSGSGLHYWITRKHNNPEFQLPTFFHQFSYFVKNQIKISFPNVKILKKKWKKHSHAYISKKKKKEIKKTSIAPAAVISQKKTLSKTLYV